MILINELLKNLKLRSRFNLNIPHIIHISYFTCYSSTLNMCYKNKETMRIFINKQNNSANKYNHRQQLVVAYLASNEKGFLFFLVPRSWYKLVSRNSGELIPL